MKVFYSELPTIYLYFSEKACVLCEAYIKASLLTPVDNAGPTEEFIDGPQLYRIGEAVSIAVSTPQITQ